MRVVVLVSPPVLTPVLDSSLLGHSAGAFSLFAHFLHPFLPSSLARSLAPTSSVSSLHVCRPTPRPSGSPILSAPTAKRASDSKKSRGMERESRGRKRRSKKGRKRRRSRGGGEQRERGAKEARV
eukprot:296554-Rhodomonas_salina.3